MTLENKRKELDTLERGRGVKYILNTAYEIFGNPIAMFDTSYNLLAYVEGVETDDRLWNELIGSGGFSHETVDFFNTECFIEKCMNSEVVSFLKSDKLKYDRINGKLFDVDGVQLANIIIVACDNTFDEHDPELIEFLCEILSEELQKSEYYEKIDRVYQESIISDLIEGSTKNKELAERNIEDLYKKLKPNLHIAVVETAQYDPTLTHLAYFRDLFRKLQGEFEYYIYLNSIVIIIDTANPILYIKRDLDKLNEFFAKYNIFAGISECFQDLLELKKYYKQAIIALNHGLIYTANRHIFAYDNFKLPAYLDSIKDDVDIEAFCNPIIRYIQNYDKLNKTSFYGIIRAYLAFGKNSHMTSEKLNISEAELSRRLQRIEELFDIDWTDGYAICSISNSIQILEYMK